MRVEGGVMNLEGWQDGVVVLLLIVLMLAALPVAAAVAGWKALRGRA